MESKQRAFTILIADHDRFMVQGIKSVISTIWGEEVRYFDYIFNPDECHSADITILSHHALLMSKRSLNDWLELTSQKLLIISDVPGNHRYVLARRQSVAALTQLLTSGKSSPIQRQKLTRRDGSGLSPLQKKIVRGLASGLRHRAIAQALNINEKSVSYHKRIIMHKLNFASKGEFHCWIAAGKEP
ncbi:LuxR C-terminal-related transcriptional regulator [Enterobacter hormaechei]